MHFANIYLRLLINLEKEAHYGASFQTADKGTDHKKRKYGYYKVKISGKISPKFLYIFIFFRLERTSAHSTHRGPHKNVFLRGGNTVLGVPVANEVSNGVLYRLGSFHLYSFSAVCQADDKVCHQLETGQNLLTCFLFCY